MNKSTLIISFIVLAIACTDPSKEVLPIMEAIPDQADSSLTDSSTFLLFEGIWEVQLYTSKVCETTSEDCHEFTLTKAEQPLYAQYVFLAEKVIAISSDKSEEQFDVSYIDQNRIIFENEATKSNQWNGTQNIEWITNDEIRMNNQFLSIDSIFIITDIFEMKRL